MADNELEILLKAKDEASKEIEKLVSAVKELEASLEKVKADQLGAVGDSALKSVDGLEQVSSAAKKSADAIASLAEATKTPLSDISGGLGDGAKTAGASLDELGTSISGLEQEVGSPIPDPTEDLKEGARETAGIVSGLSEDISDLKSSSDISVPDSTEVLREGAEATKETLSELSTTLSGLGDGDQVGDPTSDLREGAGETKDSLEELQGTLGSLVDSSGDTLPDVSQDLRGGLESTEESASSLADQVSSLRGDLESGIQSPFDDLQEGAETTSGALDSLVAGIQTVSSEASDEFSDPTETLRQGAEDTVSSVEELGDEIEQIQSVADSSIGSPFDDVEQGAEEAADSVGELGEKLRDLQEESQQGFGDPTEEMTEGAKEYYDWAERVKARVAEIRNEVADPIPAPTDEMLEGAKQTTEALREFLKEFGALNKHTEEMLNDPTQAIQLGAEVAEGYARSLREEIAGLRSELDKDFNDPTAPLQEGSEYAEASISELESELSALKAQAEVPIPDASEELADGAEEAASAMDDLASRIAKVTAVAGGLAAIGAYLKSSSAEATDFDTRFRVIEQLIKTTGREAEITAERIREMSENLALGTLASVEGVEEAAKLLVTFKSVGVESFERVLETAQDMAEVMGGDITSQVRLLGRAFEDPVRGMQMLRRYNIVLSESQEELIKKLAETGENAKIQGILMDELATKFGGAGRAAAEGLAGVLDTLSQRFQDLRRATGEAIEPAQIAFYEELIKVLEWLKENMNSIIKTAEFLGSVLLAIGAKKVLVSLYGVATAISRIGFASGAAAVQMKGLRAIMMSMPLLALATGISIAVTKLLEIKETAREAAEAQQLLVDTEENLIKKLNDISASTGVVVTSFKDVAQAVDDGRLVMNESTMSYESAAQVAERLAAKERELAEAAKVAAIRTGEFGVELQNMQAQLDAANRAGELADQFRAIAEEAEDVDKAVESLVKGLDLANKTGVEDLLFAINHLEEDSEELAATITEKVAKSLKDLNSADLRQFGDTLISQFDQARVSAENFSQFNNEVLAQSFRNLGTSYTEAITGISAQSQTAVDSVATIQAAMERANLSTDQFRVGMEAALAAAIPKTDSTALLQELRDRITSLGEAGQLSSTQVQRLNEKLDDQFRVAASLDPAVRRLEEAYRELGLTSPQALQEAAEKARESLDVLIESEASVKALQEGFEEYAARVVAANEGIITTTLQAEAAALGLVVSLDESGKVLVRSMSAAATSVESLLSGTKGLNVETGKLADSTNRLSREQRSLRVMELRAEMTRLQTAMSEGRITQDQYTAGVTKVLNALRELQREQTQTISGNKELAGSNRDVADSFDKVAGSADNASGSTKKYNVRDIGGSLVDPQNIDNERLLSEMLRNAQDSVRAARFRDPTDGQVTLAAEYRDALKARIAELNNQTTEGEKEVELTQKSNQVREQQVRTIVQTPTVQTSSASVVQQRPTQNVTFNIEGVLDLNDQVTLSNLARKLAPLLADIQRRS